MPQWATLIEDRLVGIEHFMSKLASSADLQGGDTADAVRWWRRRALSAEEELTKVKDVRQDAPNADWIRREAEAERTIQETAAQLVEVRAALADAEERARFLEQLLAVTNHDHLITLTKAEKGRAVARVAEERAQTQAVLLTERLRRGNHDAKRFAYQTEWLRAVHAIMHSALRARSPAIQRMSRESREHRLRAQLKEAGLFDAEAYLQLYPDVQAAGVDPLDHYVSHGMMEGRSPCV
ncbi:hypothetical protein [Sphingobium naphthae]|uniref:Uncharacterized protein n=2 Tax=Sphingobium TaxID=165695 RepID=A0A9X7YET4_SPHYA|nr:MULTISPECIES: hypothetical protein [Sphingobium]MDV5825827.1 hypothetical protein [Sphingobium naphthae]QNG47967.1 hypothetical protein H3V42_10490 [Sphingobium yanoikuyae]